VTRAAAGPPPAALGGCDVLYQLKSGGMGEVLLARKRAAGGFEKLVAVKTIRSDLRALPHLRAMFLDEARLLSRLDHPAIAQVHDFGEEADTLYLVMEYVSGVRFTELIRRRPPPAVCARAMAEVCRGLHAAHQLADRGGAPLGVVHRDVSPENLMMTFGGRIKVLDFGIALMRGRQAPVTEYGTIRGKPPYLSPEQLKNQPLDRRSDVFSAAVVLHEMLTGEPVFTGDSVYAVARAVEHAEVEPPSALAGALPDGLDEVVMHGMARDPEQRFDTALAMAEALDRVAASAGGESLEAWAGRELAGDRERHRGWLAEILDAGGGDGRGRASGVMTAEAVEELVGEGERGDGETGERRERVAAGTIGTVDTRSTGSIARDLRGRGRILAVIALIAVAAAALVAVVALRGNHVAASPAPDASVSVALAPAEDAAIAAASDAAAPPASIVDAGLTDAAPRRGGRDGHKRSDAGVIARPVPPPPPPPRPVDAGAATSPGYITVAAHPFALVRIDGAEIGSTPIFRHSLAAGRHQVQLVSPDNGAVRLDRTIVIRPGQLERIVVP